ncbi:MAG: hypothetical protein EAX95_10800 [Candidatus Thorarchaeota archaeon]|nr:hypothetical protein [Candidatus Thorarchaeota archaeon]
MRRRILVAAAVVLAVTPIILIPILMAPRFEWGIEVGDELQFGIGVFGTYGINPGISIYPVPFVEYNNTRIICKIVNLPAVGGIYTADQLITLVQELKIECEFTNGIEIPPEAIDGYYTSQTKASICTVLSRAILPVGGWDTINGFFPEEPENPWACYTYVSKKLTECMFFGYRSANIDAGWGWGAHLNLTTGMPFTVTHWEQSFTPGYIWLDYRVEISSLLS